MNDGAAHAGAVLVSLKIITAGSGKIGVEALIAEEIVAFTVVGVGTRLGGNVDRSGGSQLGREIQRGLLDLKFLDGVLGDVLGGGADGFVADIEAIHFDASGAPETATEGNR